MFGKVDTMETYQKLPMNVIMTPPGKKTTPRPKASYGPKASYRYRTTHGHPNANVLQENSYETHEYEGVSSDRYVHKTKNFFAYSYEYCSPPRKLFARSPKPKFSDAALRLIASRPPLKIWVVKKN